MNIHRKIVHEKYHKKRRMQKRFIDSHNFTYFNLLRVISPYLSKDKKVIDIGCGVGTIPFYIASKGINVVGVDISENAITVAKENAEYLKVNKRILFRVVDFPKSDINGKYGLVLMSEVLEHLPDDNLVLKKVRKNLVKGGILIASSPSIHAPLYRIGLLGKFDKEVGHLRRYSENDFKELFKQSGYKIIKFYKTEGILRNIFFTNDVLGKFIKFFRWFISDIINLIDAWTIPIFGESQYYIVAKKI